MHESPMKDSTSLPSARGWEGNARMDQSVNKPVYGLKRFMFSFNYFRLTVVCHQLVLCLFKVKGLPVKGLKSGAASNP